MNAFETKAVHAAGLFLDRKGYNVRETGWEDPEGAGSVDVIAEDEGALVFIDVIAEEGADGFPVNNRSRKQREILAARWLAGADEEVVNMPVRFDDISFMVMGETRALLRHHINALSEA